MIKKDEDQVNERILTVARALFNEFGIENVSMHRIAKTAEVGQGTLYRRYSNKSALCMALMEKQYNEFIKNLKEDLAEIRELNTNKRLKHVLIKTNLMIGESLDWMRILTISGNLEESSRAMYNSCFYTSVKEIIKGILKEAVDKQEASIKDINLTSTILATNITPELMFHLHESGYSYEEIASNYAEIQTKSIFM
ncbi:TetR/AcrR family transcriptional regulator [Terribacillus saccharophilus]|uniref:TetR/AcrR family transcriptional regulator n=1 Tax=Terribacillus saccharophilus TaxID=361277 RepID=UPI00398296AD